MNFKLKIQCFLFIGLFTFARCLASENDLSKKVARLFIVGMRGTELTPDNAVVRDITQRGVSGVVLFEHNLHPADQGVRSDERPKKLCHDLQALTPRKLLIGIDQEGGKVNRLKPKYGFPSMLSHQYLGRVDHRDTTALYADNIARSLKEMGINTNFAPCVDVNINPLCPIIGKVERSFSSDPEKVIEHATYFIDQHHKKGILCALKHFPGHGSSTSDSHLGFVDISSTWKEKELLPYRALVGNQGVDMVMISHVFNSKIDKNYPSTLSHKCIDSLLRRELGWNGVVITDDMHMKAIADNYTPQEALMRSINAGCDLIIISSNISKGTDYIAANAIDVVVKLINEGKIKEQRIDEAIERIDRMLSQLGN